MSVAGSALPGIEAERVGHWLAEHVDGLAGPVEFGLVSGGRSNLTYRLTDAAGATYALRRPPTGGVLSTAHDVSREWRFICAMAPTAVPVARPVAYCADAAVTGAEFYVMEFVEAAADDRIPACVDDDRGLQPVRGGDPPALRPLDGMGHLAGIWFGAQDRDESRGVDDHAGSPWSS